MYEAELKALDSGATVVTANNRLARTLGRAYEQQRVAEGAEAWPSPAIISWAAWLKNLWAEARLLGHASATKSLLDDDRAAFIWQIVVRDAERGREYLPLNSFARSAQQTWTLLHDWQAFAAEEWQSPDLSPDQQGFKGWALAYQERCAAENWVDSARLPGSLARLAEAGAFDSLGPLTFAGFDSWPPARANLRDALRARDIPLQVIAPAQASQPCTGQPAESPHDEIVAAACWARQLYAKDASAAIGVVVPDLATRAEEVRRVFADVFVPEWRIKGWPDGAPLNVSYGRALLDVPLIHAAMQLLGLTVGRCAFNELSLLLRSPWLGGYAAEAGARAQLDVYLRRKVRIEFALGDVVLACKQQTPEFGAILEGVQAAAADRKKRTAADWAISFSKLLEQSGWPTASKLGSDAWQAHEAWQDTISLFASSAGELGLLDRQEALGSLGSLMAQRIFQPEGSASGVQVMGALEAAGHQFSHLWVAGMARESWPASGGPDPFIPLSLQRRLGMPDSSAEQVLNYASAVTSRLLGSAETVVVSWPTWVDEQPFTASPLLGEVELLQEPVAPADNALWNTAGFAARGTELLDDDPPPPLVSAGTFPGGIGVLNLQAISPLNAFIEKRLGAFEFEVPAVGIDPMQRGTLLHGVLEELYKRARSSGQLRGLADAGLEATLTEWLELGARNFPGANEAFMQRLIALEITRALQLLNQFIAIDLARPGFSDVVCEQPRDVNVGPLQLGFRLDRLDQLPGGGSFVIDYKTGAIDRQKWNPAKPRDLQLPVYVCKLAPDAEGIAFAQLSPHNVGFDGVGAPNIDIDGMRSPGATNKIQVKYQYPDTDILIESWSDLRKAWGELIEKLANEFAAGDYRFDPRNKDSARGHLACLSRVYDDATVLALQELEE